MNTCIIDDCPKEVHVKKHGLCRSHYNKLKYYGRITGIEANTECKLCGQPTPPAKNSGPRPAYCTTECRQQATREASRDRARDARAAKRMSRTPRPCDWCDKPLPQDAPGMRRFHPDCAKLWSKATRKADNHNRQCTHDGCDRPTRARDLCSMHYKRWARAEGLVKPEPWDDRRKSNYHRRRARKMALPSEAVVPGRVYDRDGWKCGICGDAVDSGVAWPDPLSPSLDHVIPLARGGHHTYANAQLAHLVCNIRKSDKIVEDFSSQT